MKFIITILFSLLIAYTNAVQAGFGGNTKDSVQTATTFLSKLIQIRSLSGKEKVAAKFLLKSAIKEGFNTKIFSDNDSTYNFSASLYPLNSGKPNIVFLCHIDVVPAVDSAEWKYPPFSGAVIKDTIWGRGCIDMKGIGVMQLMATAKFIDKSKQKNLPYNVTVLFVSGEESGGTNGAAIITEKYMQELNPAVVFGEGGAGVNGVLPSKQNQDLFFISVAEKKSLWLRLHVNTHSHGHASVPTNETANRILLKAMNKLEDDAPIIIFDKTTKQMFHKLGELNGGYKGFILKHLNAVLLHPFRRAILSRQDLLMATVTNTFQLTNIHNPVGPPNVIPGTADAYYDCRLLPGVKTVKFMRKIRRRILNPRVKVTIIDQSPDGTPSKPDKYYMAMEKAIQKNYPHSEIVPVLFPATTDNSYFRAKGIPCFGILPINIGQKLIETVHGPNECIPVNTLMQGIETYRLFIAEMMK